MFGIIGTMISIVPANTGADTTYSTTYTPQRITISDPDPTLAYTTSVPSYYSPSRTTYSNTPYRTDVTRSYQSYNPQTRTYTPLPKPFNGYAEAWDITEQEKADKTAAAQALTKARETQLAERGKQLSGPQLKCQPGEESVLSTIVASYKSRVEQDGTKRLSCRTSASRPYGGACCRTYTVNTRKPTELLTTGEPKCAQGEIRFMKSTRDVRADAIYKSTGKKITCRFSPGNAQSECCTMA